MIFFITIYIPSMVFKSGDRGGQSVSSISACQNSHLETEENCEWSCCYLEVDCSSGIVLLEIVPFNFLRRSHIEGRLSSFP
jgi:hypothetical protein